MLKQDNYLLYFVFDWLFQVYNWLLALQEQYLAFYIRNLQRNEKLLNHHQYDYWLENVLIELFVASLSHHTINKSLNYGFNTGLWSWLKTIPFPLDDKIQRESPKFAIIYWFGVTKQVIAVLPLCPYNELYVSLYTTFCFLNKESKWIKHDWSRFPYCSIVGIYNLF